MLGEKQTAPDFELPLFGGQSTRFYVPGAETSVLIFYKHSCPTCQLTLPYLQKIYDAYGDAFRILAVAQDGHENTERFRNEYKISIPTFLDEMPYTVSDQYDLKTVPTIFMLDSEYRVQYAEEGFIKQQLLNLADILAERSGRDQIDLFQDADVPELKPG